MEFLSSLSPRPLADELPEGWSAEGLYLAENRQNLLEVAVARSESKPLLSTLASTWKKRLDRRSVPVLLVVIYGDRCSICGPSGKAPVVENVELCRAETLTERALGMPNRLSARDFLFGMLPTLQTELPGIVNKGLLATHNLRAIARRRKDWHNAGQRARQVAGLEGEQMLGALGYMSKPLDDLTKVLYSSGKKRTALAVVLAESEGIESESPKFNKLSPISYALLRAAEERLSRVIIARGGGIRLYCTEDSRGASNQERTETYIECRPQFLAEEDWACLWLLFSADALQRRGSLEWLRASSEREAFLHGVRSSLTFISYANWYAHSFVKLKPNIHILHAFPFPTQESVVLQQRLVALAGRLACPDEHFAQWVAAVGLEYGLLDDAVRKDMICEIDAVVAHLYGLSAEQLRQIFENFRDGWNYKPRLRQVMHHFEVWEGRL